MCFLFHVCTVSRMQRACYTCLITNANVPMIICTDERIRTSARGPTAATRLMYANSPRKQRREPSDKRPCHWPYQSISAALANLGAWRYPRDHVACCMNGTPCGVVHPARPQRGCIGSSSKPGSAIDSASRRTSVCSAHAGVPRNAIGTRGLRLGLCRLEP